MKTYKLWDTKEKMYFDSNPQESLKKAEDIKNNCLDAGVYPDDPHTVIEIHEFVDNIFIKKID
jgi:hypothetical protein